MKFPSIKKYVKRDDPLIYPTELSKPQIHIPALMSEYGGGLHKVIRTRRHILHKMAGCLIESKKSASSIKNNPKHGQRAIRTEDLEALEAYIHSLGIDGIGYTKVDRNLIFKDKCILYENAIVITMEMNKEPIQSAPSSKAVKEIFRTYYALGVVVNQISSYLRKNGYNAMAGPALAGDVSYVPLAQDAGLGVIGKHGLLISDAAYGPSLRIAAVFTDIENLPFSQENPHLWVKDFCNQCNKCVKTCPAGAIYQQALPVGDEQVPSRCIDHTKCAVPFANNYGCTVCVRSCAFFNGDYQKIKSSFLKQKNESE